MEKMPEWEFVNKYWDYKGQIDPNVRSNTDQTIIIVLNKIRSKYQMPAKDGFFKYLNDKLLKSDQPYHNPKSLEKDVKLTTHEVS